MLKDVYIKSLWKYPINKPKSHSTLRSNSEQFVSVQYFFSNSSITNFKGARLLLITDTIISSSMLAYSCEIIFLKLCLLPQNRFYTTKSDYHPFEISDENNGAFRSEKYA